MFNVLEGDGVIENIYHFLWTKDTIFNTDPQVYIPQTILYKYQKPCYWYFTSVIDHRLKKKNASKLNKDTIRQIFLKHISKSGIVAYYIYKKIGLPSKYESDKPTFEKIMKGLIKPNNYETSKNNNYINSENVSIKFYNQISIIIFILEYQNGKSDNKNNESYIIEYFDIAKFNDFLNKNVIYDDGILQKFEDPKGEHNITYRLTWSPKLCLFEKCTNLKKINDKHYDIYERAVTYDGEEFQTRTEPLKGNNLPERIEKIGLNIVNHVSNITLEKIKIIRMILNFKIDKRDRIIFLWCSSLRIETGMTNAVPQRLNIGIKSVSGVGNNPWLNKRKSTELRIKEIDNEKIKLRPPDSVNIFKYSISGKPIQPKKESICLNCGQKVENYRLYEIKFKTIIEGHDNRKRDKQFYNIFNKINMTSTGIEVMPNTEKKNNDEIFNKLKANKLNNFIIPKIIQELYPKLKFQDYFNLKNDSVFRNKTTCVCDDCYLEITKYCSMAGSNNENLIRSLKKDECLSPFFYMVNSVRPKSVIRKNKNNILDELSLDNKKEINKNRQNKFQIDINNTNSNLIPYLKEKDKKNVKNKLFTIFNNKYNLSSKKLNILNKNSKKNNKNEFDIIFPKLNNITESNFGKNLNFRDITTNRVYTETFSNEDNNSKYTSKDKIKREEKKNNLKNYLTKKDFTYFS